MDSSRRQFLTGATGFVAVSGAALLPGRRAQAGQEADPQHAKSPQYQMSPVGTVEKTDDRCVIRIFEEYVEALLGLDQWSHVNVLYWFDKNDVPHKRRILQVNPRGNRENPLTGVFACRAPVRPNLLALSMCRILSVEGAEVRVDDIDAFDGTPVVDLKPATPADVPKEGVKVPDWARR